MDRGIRVLHVDDDPDVVAVVAEFLERQDDRIQVSTETDVGRGIDRLGEQGFDCIVSDYDMPRTNGLEFLERVRDRYGELPFILYTGKGSEEVASDAISAGVTDYLQKGTGEEQYELLANRIVNSVQRYHQKRDLARYETIVAAAGDGVYTLDQEGRFTTVNEYVVDQTGYSRDELLGSHVSLLLPESGIERGREIVEQLLTDPDATVGSHETTVTTADGETLPIEVRIALLQAEDGSFEGTIGIARDLTARRERQRELERYETMVETVADGVYALDATGHYTYINSYIEERTGYRREDVIGAHASKFLDNADVDRIEEAVAAMLDSSKEMATLEVDIPAADGGSLPTEIRLTPLPYEDEYQGLVGILRDISNRRERERKLERHNARLREFETLVETVPAGVFQLDADGVMTTVNDEWAAMTGKAKSTLEGAPFERLVDEGIIPDTVIQKYQSLLRDLLSEASDRRRGTIRTRATPPGSTDEHVYEAHIAPLPYEDAFVGSAVVVRDITEQERYSRELERQNERLEEFASVVSHDLRNPLTVANGRLELAMEECASPHLEAVARSHDRMEALIGDLLNLAREGETVEELETVHLGTVLDESWAAVDTAAATLTAPVDVHLRADPGRLQQLLENLIRNAVEHGGDDVTVTVGTMDDGTGFFVEDDGPGIAPEERERVFESGYSTTPTGTGFGLAIVMEIAHAHDWSVAITAGDHGGARVEVTGISFE